MKGLKQFSNKRKDFSTKNAGTTIQKSDLQPISHTIHKNQLDLGHRPEGKMGMKIGFGG